MRNFLRICLEIEEIAARIYQTLAQSDIYDSKLRAIWVKMAEEEKEHALQIRFASRLPGEKVFKDSKPVEGVQKLLIEARSVLTRIEKEPLTEGDALRLALNLEERFCEVHVSTANNFIDEKMKELFKSMTVADKDHLAPLREYHRNYFEGEQGTSNTKGV